MWLSDTLQSENLSENCGKVQRRRKAGRSPLLLPCRQSRRHGRQEPTHPQQPEVTDTRPALPSPPKKPTDAPLSSKKRPRQRTAVNHITPQPAARRGKYKNCGGAHFKVGKGLGMMNIRLFPYGSRMGRAERCCASHMPVTQYVMLNVKNGRIPTSKSR